MRKLAVGAVMLLVLVACTNNEAQDIETPVETQVETTNVTEENVEPETAEPEMAEPVENTETYMQHEDDDFGYDVGVGYGTVDISNWTQQISSVGFENLGFPENAAVEILLEQSNPVWVEAIIQVPGMTSGELFRGLQVQLQNEGYVVYGEPNSVVDMGTHLNINLTMVREDTLTKVENSTEDTYHYCGRYRVLIGEEEGAFASIDYSRQPTHPSVAC